MAKNLKNIVLSMIAGGIGAYGVATAGEYLVNRRPLEEAMTCTETQQYAGAGAIAGALLYLTRKRREQYD